jgi:hypothetical protein
MKWEISGLSDRDAAYELGVDLNFLRDAQEARDHTPAENIIGAAIIVIRPEERGEKSPALVGVVAKDRQRCLLLRVVLSRYEHPWSQTP